ncbi:DUF6988 family protein [Pseudomonas segetis]
MSSKGIDLIVERSIELYSAFQYILGDDGFYEDDRSIACIRLCLVCHEHGLSVLMLSGIGNSISAASLLRLQFEALVRALWFLYAAPNEDLEKFTGNLTLESLELTRKMPSINEMLKALDKAENFHAYGKVMLKDVREKLLSEMNSFVHAGIMSYKLQELGTPEVVVIKNIKHSNGISTMAAMALALISTDQSVVPVMSAVQPKFADCLPPLVTPTF